jgi:hypothetical protein
MQMQHVMRTANDKLVSNVSGNCPNLDKEKPLNHLAQGSVVLFCVCIFESD